MTYYDYVEDRKLLGHKRHLTRAQWLIARKKYTFKQLDSYIMPKRSYGQSQGPFKSQQNGGGKRRRFVKGRDRTGGNWGRYSGRNAELKFFDTDTNDAVIAINGQIDFESMNLIPQGITESTRVGRKCTLRKLLWKYQLQLTAVAAATINVNETVRVILYHDKQCNGAVATPTLILSADDFQAFRQLEETGRFTILMDRTHQLNVEAAAGDGAANDSAPVARNYSFYKDVNIPLEFSGTSGAITTIRSSNISYVTFAANGGNASMTGVFRVRFSDAG